MPNINLTGVEATANKSTNVNTDQASNTKYPSVKAVFDWAVGLFVKKGTLTTNYIQKASDSNTITNSVITDTDGLVKISDMTIGRGAGLLADNTALGVDVLLNATTIGTKNVGIGYFALRNAVTAYDNVGIGYYALNMQLSFGSTAIGARTLANCVAEQNTAIGCDSQYSNVGGIDNTSVGFDSLKLNVNSGYNTAIGTRALAKTVGNGASGFNVGVGLQALYNNTSGILNVAIGSNALYNNTTANGSVAIGHNALFNSNGATNIGIGYFAGYYETGSGKLFIDNDPRSSEATGRTESLIYGEFNAVPANQLFRVNGQLNLSLETASTMAEIDANKNIKSITTTNARTRLGVDAGTIIVTSGTSFTTPSTITTATIFLIELVGGGAGGGGMNTSSASASGGGAGGYCFMKITGLTPSTTYTCAIGAGGAGGAAAANGVDGGDTTLIIGVTTYTASGGIKGIGAISSNGGVGGTGTNGDINVNGQSGGDSPTATTGSTDGAGGSSHKSFGNGGAAVRVGKSGNNATGYGGGGSGAKGVGFTGGNGTNGIIYCEYFN